MGNFANNLRQLREGAGLTQQQLAEKLHVTRQTVSGWERGRTEPDVAALATLSKVLQVSADTLLLGKKPDQYPRFQGKYILSGAIGFAAALAVFVLSVTVLPYWREQVYMYYRGMTAYFLMAHMGMPLLAGAGLGVLLGSIGVLLFEVNLYGRWKNAALAAGLAAALLPLGTGLNYMLASWIPGYHPKLTISVIYLTAQFPAMHMLVYGFLPFLSGLLLFLRFHKKTDA